MAAHRGSLSIVIVLLECGADVNIRDDNCDTPLHLACSEVSFTVTFHWQYFVPKVTISVL
jgi:ankyrin repeat protein